MTYQELVTLLRNSAIAVNANGYNVHATEAQANLEYDKLFPQILILEIRDRPVRASGNNSWEILVGVVDQDDPASNPDINMTDDVRIKNQEKILREMWILKEQFMNNLYSNQRAQISGESWRRSIQQMMATHTGWYGQFIIGSKLPRC